MPAPISYLSPRVDPMAKALQGLQLGSSIRNIREQTAARDQAIQAQEAAKKRQAQYGVDLEAAFDNPTPSTFAKLTLQYPEQREALKQASSGYSQEQVNNELVTLGQVYSALSSDNLDVALNIADEQITAFDNAGKDSSKIKMLRDNIEKDPKNAKGFAGLMLSSLMDPKEFITTFKGLDEVERLKDLHPIEKEKLIADVSTTAENTRLRAMEAALRKEDNELKREQLRLKISAAKKKQEVSAADRIASAEGAIATMDNTIGTAEKLLNHPGLKTATGVTSFMGNIPGTDAREFTGLVETLKSQTFLSEVEKMKGMGALSENEGKKISASIANLDLGQSSEAFKRSLSSALKTFKVGRERMVKKYGDVLKKPEEETVEAEEETEVTPSKVTTKSYMKWAK